MYHPVDENEWRNHKSTYIVTHVRMHVSPGVPVFFVPRRYAIQRTNGSMHVLLSGERFQFGERLPACLPAIA